MKIFKILFFTVAVALFTSCSTDDVEDRPIIEPVSEPVLAAPNGGSIYNLTFEKSTDLAERFVWSEADFGGDVQVQYDVQIDKEGNEFASPEVLGSVNDGSTQLAVTGEVLNNTVLALGATPFEAANYDVRIRAAVGEMEMYSETIQVTVVPFTTEAPKLYVTGSFVSASGYGNDWTPGDAVPLAAPGFGQTAFEGYIYMANDGAEYKFLPTNEGWDGDYGDAGPENGSYTQTLLQEGEVNAGTPDGTGGYFLVKADTEALTYSLTETNWGIIGSATPTGWDSDTDMTYDPAAKVWTITINLVGGEYIKFRANDAWDINLGDDNDDDGFMNYGGPDIQISADGNYTVTLDLSNPREYTYNITSN